MYKEYLSIKSEWEENPAGGFGKLYKSILLSPNECPPDISFCNLIELQPNSAIGDHMHNGNGEIYYFLNGAGKYNDNGIMRTVHAGDVTVCYDGEMHGVSNNGEDGLKFLAIKFVY